MDKEIFVIAPGSNIKVFGQVCYWAVDFTGGWDCQFYWVTPLLSFRPPNLHFDGVVFYLNILNLNLFVRIRDM